MMESHINDLEEKLNSSLENLTMIEYELEYNKSSASEQIERLKQQVKGFF